MSTGRRYTADDFMRMADACVKDKQVFLADYFRQAAKSESQVMGLVDAIEELLPIAISSETNGPVERERIREAREALSKFRGET